MTNVFQDINDFHRKFGLDYRNPAKKPSRSMVRYRLKFMLEELDELARAAVKDDLVEMTDALVDLIYVAAGTGWLLNLPLEAAWAEVHHANMKKERAKTDGESKRGTKLDIIKPKGWVPPNLSQFFCQTELAMKVEASTEGEQYDLVDYLNKLRETPNDHEQDKRDSTA